MKRIVAAATTLGLALSLGGSSASAEQVSVRPPAEADTSILDLLQKAMQVPPDEAEALRADYERYRQYWEDRGETKVAATELVILSGSGTTVCGLGGAAVTLTALSVSQYCAGTEHGTIVMTANSINGNTAGRSWRIFGVAHELGHAYWDARPPASEDQVVRENKSTCIAGVAMAALETPDVIEEARSHLASLPAARAHGPGAVEAQALMQGVTTGQC